MEKSEGKQSTTAKIATSNQKSGCKNTNKTGMLLKTKEAHAISYRLKIDVKNELDRLIKTGHLER